MSVELTLISLFSNFNVLNLCNGEFAPLVLVGIELSNNVSKLPPKLRRNEKMSPFCR